MKLFNSSLVTALFSLAFWCCVSVPAAAGEVGAPTTSDDVKNVPRAKFCNAVPFVRPPHDVDEGICEGKRLGLLKRTETDGCRIFCFYPPFSCDHDGGGCHFDLEGGEAIDGVAAGDGLESADAFDAHNHGAIELIYAPLPNHWTTYELLLGVNVEIICLWASNTEDCMELYAAKLQEYWKAVGPNELAAFVALRSDDMQYWEEETVPFSVSVDDICKLSSYEQSCQSAFAHDLRSTWERRSAETYAQFMAKQLGTNDTVIASTKTAEQAPENLTRSNKDMPPSNEACATGLPIQSKVQDGLSTEEEEEEEEVKLRNEITKLRDENTKLRDENTQLRNEMEQMSAADATEMDEEMESKINEWADEWCRLHEERSELESNLKSCQQQLSSVVAREDGEVCGVTFDGRSSEVVARAAEYGDTTSADYLRDCQAALDESIKEQAPKTWKQYFVPIIDHFPFQVPAIFGGGN